MIPQTIKTLQDNGERVVESIKSEVNNCDHFFDLLRFTWLNQETAKKITESLASTDKISYQEVNIKALSRYKADINDCATITDLIKLDIVKIFS